MIRIDLITLGRLQMPMLSVNWMSLMPLAVGADMATTAINTSDDSIITSNALDLLTCFQDGLDDVIYQFAEEIAKKRQVESGSESADLVTIDVQDVREAGEQLTAMIKQMVKAGQLSPEIESRVSIMRECLDCK